VDKGGGVHVKWDWKGKNRQKKLGREIKKGDGESRVAGFGNYRVALQSTVG